MRINEYQWSKNWFEHDDVMTTAGEGQIEFELGQDVKSKVGSLGKYLLHRKMYSWSSGNVYY